jgi:uncharacterized membrane protein YqjE
MSTRIERVDSGVSNGRYLPPADGTTAQTDASMRDLLRQLADDGADLVRGEIALAKLEMKETARSFALDAVKLAAALALAWVGGLALTAFLIIGLGNLMGGAYWASALIVGVVLLAIGGLMAQRGIAGLQGNSIKPDATVESLQEDKRWASQEVRGLKESLKS